MKCGHCGSGKGEFFLTNPPFHVDKDQCIRNLRAELVAIEKRTQSPVAGSDCGAGNYFDELKCHGCIEIPCEHCGVSYCSHWPYCPRCILQRFRDVEKHVTAAQLLKGKILNPNGSLVFDPAAIRAFLDELPKETPVTNIRCGYCDEYQDEAVPHNPKTCIDSLTSRLEEEKKGRERDREQFRQGVAGWQDRIAEVEKRIQAAQDTITKRLRNCAGVFPKENPDGCEGPCVSFGCKTLRGIRDALEE